MAKMFIDKVCRECGAEMKKVFHAKEWCNDCMKERKVSQQRQYRADPDRKKKVYESRKCNALINKREPRECNYCGKIFLSPDKKKFHTCPKCKKDNAWKYDAYTYDALMAPPL